MERSARHSGIPTPQHTILFSGSPTRLDAWLATARPDLSRARWQRLIRDGRVLVNGRATKPSHVLHDGDAIGYTIPLARPAEVEPEAIPLEVLYEDDDLLVINKPAGLVVHPAPGHPSGTLVNALLHHCGSSLAGIGGERRPGIVHRLDRDTSGLLVVAKNEAALNELAAQFKARRVWKEYLALVWGEPRPVSGTIRTLIGRNPHNRKKMSTRPVLGRMAVTHYEVVKRLGPVSLLRVRIETGRTHQIRVHLAHLGHPVVGDRQYGRARKTALPAPVPRQMLHAERLAFAHPVTGERQHFEAPWPEDFRTLLAVLRRHAPA